MIDQTVLHVHAHTHTHTHTQNTIELDLDDKHLWWRGPFVSNPTCLSWFASIKKQMPRWDSMCRTLIGGNICEESRRETRKDEGRSTLQLFCRFDICKEKGEVGGLGDLIQMRWWIQKGICGILQSAVVPAAGAAHFTATISCTLKGFH